MASIRGFFRAYKKAYKQKIKSNADLISPLLRYLEILVWSGMIFYLSSLPGTPNSSTDMETFLERKGAHIFEYIVLSVLCLRAFSRSFGVKGNRAVFFSVAFCFLFAVSDEIHQVFVFGRSGKSTDVMIDLAGIILGFWLYKMTTVRKK